MVNNYFLFYAEATVVCVLIFGLLLLNDRAGVNRQEKQVVFDRALIAHILYFMSDVIWAGVIAGVIPRTRFSVACLNFINFILLSAIAYEWFVFAAVSERRLIRETKRGRLPFLLPMAVMTAVMLLAYLIAPTFWVSESAELNALYYPMMLAAPLTYVFSSCILSLKQAKKAEVPADRRLFLMIGLYPLAIVFFGVVQLAYVAAPLFCFGCTIMMLFFYIRSMEDRISLDPLTGLNNRGQLMRYAAQERGHKRENVGTFVIIMDADDFKQINDTYGHAQGDRALVQIADALRSCAKDMHYPPLLSRYGGDEFVVVAHAENPSEMESVAEQIRAELRNGCAEAETPYELSVSIGYDEWNTEQESFQDCLQRADEKLYAEKRGRTKITSGRF